MSEIWAEYQEYEPKKEGVYLGQVLEITRDQGDYGEFCLIRFALHEGPDEGEITGIASLKWSPKAKLYKWTRALNGNDETGFAKGFKPAMVVGKCAQLVVKHEEDNGRVRDIITELIPITQDQASRVKTLPKTEAQIFAEMEATI